RNRHHVGIFGVDVEEICFVRSGRSIAYSLAHDDGVVTILQGIDRRGADAAAGRAARHDHGVDAARAQQHVEVGAKKGTGVLLLDDALAGQRLNSLVDFDERRASLQDGERGHLLHENAAVAQIRRIDYGRVDDRQLPATKRVLQLARGVDLPREVAAERRRGVGEAVDEIDNEQDRTLAVAGPAREALALVVRPRAALPRSRKQQQVRRRSVNPPEPGLLPVRTQRGTVALQASVRSPPSGPFFCFLACFTQRPSTTMTDENRTRPPFGAPRAGYAPRYQPRSLVPSRTAQSARSERSAPRAGGSGKKEIFCAIGVDVDAVAGWLGSYGGENSPCDISRGLFAGEIGVPRLVD